MDIRPPWQGPDFKPKDLKQSTLALAHGSNPNDPVRPAADVTMHNKWGQLKSKHETAVMTRSLDFEIGMDTKRRREQHRMLMVSAFQSREFGLGLGKYLTEEVLIKINHQRKGNKYISEEDAFLVRNDKYKNEIKTDPCLRYFNVGINKDGYWNNAYDISVRGRM